MNKKIFLLLLLPTMVFFGCRDASGGSGADADMSGYYSKTEVNDLISNLEVEIGNKASFIGSAMSWEPGGVSYYPLFSKSDGTSTEARAQTAMPTSGKIKNVTFNAGTNTLTSSATLKVRKNGSDTGVSITIGTGSTGVFTSSSSVSFDKEDLISFSINSASGTGILYATISMLYE